MPSGQNPPSGQSGDATRLPAPKNEPPTRVVDAFLPRRSRNIDRGTECLKAGRPGFWCVLACTRRVSLSTSVEMIGDGALGEVVIEAKGRDVALFQASDGRNGNLTLRQGGGGKGIWLGVDIAQGASPLEGCEITSQSIACVGIRGGANPPGCSATASTWKDAGVYVDDNGQRGAGGQRHLRQRFFGRGNQDGVRSAAIKTVGAPISSL